MAPPKPPPPEYRFPLRRSNVRALPPDYAGPIDVFDIDKTYLESEFESLGALARTALERAVDKRTRPGLGALLRALRRGPRPDDPGHIRAPLYFVSASPPQLRSVLEGKMLLDGVEWDGISYKDHLALLKAGRFREVRRHAGYKLTALLEYRLEWPAGAREWLFGDDAESDAAIYSLYADIRAGELVHGRLDLALAREKVAGPDRKRIAELAERAPRGPVEAIFIFRATGKPKLDLARFPRVTPVEDALACAEALAARGRVAAAAVAAVRDAMKA